MVRKVIVGVLGGVFFVAGLAMTVLPGPAFIFIPLGLLILATEFKWAERWAQKAQDVAHNARVKWRARKRRRAALASKA
jgi:tellurite resistance protein TerC